MYRKTGKDISKMQDGLIVFFPMIQLFTSIEHVGITDRSMLKVGAMFIWANCIP